MVPAYLLLGGLNAVLYNITHYRVIQITSSTATPVIGNAMLSEHHCADFTVFLSPVPTFKIRFFHSWPQIYTHHIFSLSMLNFYILLHAGMIKVVGVVILSAFLLGESSIFTIRCPFELCL